MADVQWIKIATNMFDNRKIRQIEKMPEGDSIIVIWVKLICLAGTINDSGLIYFTKDIPFTDEMIANQFDRPLNTVRLALKTFEQFGMIEIVNNILMLSSWEKYQNIESLEKMREQAKLRKQKQRSLQTQSFQELPDLSRDSHVTSQPSHATEKKRIEKNREDIYSVYTTNVDLLSALADFEKMRKTIKKPLTDKAKQMLLSELNKLASDDETKIAILNQSIFHNWQGVFTLKTDTPQAKQATGNVFFDMLKEEQGG